MQYPDIYNMRFSAVADTTQGMVAILSTDDPAERRFEIKRFLAWGTDDKNVRLSLGRLPSDPHSQREIVFEGESTLTALPCTNPEACWHDAATWFRAKVDSEGYLTRGPMEDQPPEVQSLLGLDTSIAVGHNLGTDNPVSQSFPGYLAYLEETSAWLGFAPSQFNTTWFDWHTNAFDTDLPQHLPALPEYIETVSKAKALGYFVLPYTTPSAWAYNLDSYAALDVGKKWGILNRYGEPHEYEHLPGHVHHAVDFAVPSLGEYFSESFYNELFAEHQVSGLYLDFFPRPARCHATDHGHEIGGGASFVNGVRTYMEMIKKQGAEMTGGSLLVAEAISDYLVDYVSLGNCYRTDGGLIRIDDGRLGHIPLFDAVFRDITQMGSLAMMDMPGAGIFTYARSLEPNLPGAIKNLELTIALEMGWSFAAGHMLIVMRRPIPNPLNGDLSMRDDKDFKGLMDLYKTLVTMRARPDVKAIVVYGKMAVPPEFVKSSPNVPMPATVSKPSLVPLRIMPEMGDAVPAVFVYAFKNKKGDLAFTIYNWTDKAQPLSFIVNPERYGMETDGKALSHTWRVTVHNGTNSTVLAPDLNQQPEWMVPTISSLPSRDPWILLYEKQVPDPG